MAIVSEQDHELLSAYVDGMLSENERLALEARLRSDETLLRELTALYLTLALLKQLPPLAAPRDFTLEAAPARWLIFPATPVFSALSAAAATFLVAIGLLFLLSSGGQQAAPSGDQAQVAQQITATPTLAQTATGPEQFYAATGTPAQETAEIGVMIAPVESSETPPEAGAAATANLAASTMADESAPAAATEEAAISIAAAPTQEAARESGPTGTPTATVTSTEGTTSAAFESAPAALPSATTEIRPEADTSGDAFGGGGRSMTTETPAAQLEIMQALPSETPTQPPTATVTSTETASAAPTASPASAVAQNTGGLEPLLGGALVLGGGLLLGIAFMTGVRSREKRIRARRQER
ncbi:MAG: zf-HC2 domain-containing protein [Chloroflexi bacterium]|nr:zf-HC2 domain-containing protein [Chloroflexota bacterium]